MAQIERLKKEHGGEIAGMQALCSRLESQVNTYHAGLQVNGTHPPQPHHRFPYAANMDYPPTNMVLITSDYGTMRSLIIKWP